MVVIISMPISLRLVNPKKIIKFGNVEHFSDSGSRLGSLVKMQTWAQEVWTPPETAHV